MSTVSIVVPAHNEKQRLGPTLESYANNFERFKNGEYEIIVVNNGCEDNTQQIAEDFARKNNHIKSINIPEKVGKGGAIKAGLKYASGEICIFADADGSTPASELERLIFTVEDGFDVAIGSRRMKESQILVRQPLSRRIAGWVFHILVLLIFGLPFRDTQCGAKAFRKNATDVILSRVKTNGFSFDVDMLWKLRRSGYRIKEVPVTWKDSNGSSLSIYRSAPRMLYEIVRLRFDGK